MDWRFFVKGALLCCLFGCSERGSEGAAKSEEGRVSLAPSAAAESASGTLDHLPRFVDGGLRCEVRAPEPEKKAFGPPAATPSGLPFGAFRLTGSLQEEAPCTGPGPLCAVFGPSQTDIENHRLRQEVKAQREWHERRSAELRSRVRRAEESAEKERRARLAQAGQLGPYARGVYLTNDESLSLASPQRLIWAIDHDAPLPSHLVRPHELLNYFSFATLPVNDGEVFSVLPELSPHPMRPSDYTLGFSVLGRTFSKESRHNTNLTYVLDRSGSMAGGDRLELLKRGVFRSFQELKSGDIVSIVLFDTTTCPLAQNFVVGRDDMNALRTLVSSITPRGGSNLEDALLQGYETVNRSYQPGYSNRVLLLTDVEGTGTSADENVIRISAQSYDARRIRLSAVGLGDTVSDELLDRLTEAGKGASLFVSSKEELDAIFGRRFTSLLETVATNVHFRLELPPAISLRAFYGEEASTQKGRVQAVHFFSGTQQMYLANLEKSRNLRPTDFIRLSIEFDDPETGEPKSSEFSWRADELEMATGEKSKFASRNLNKARMVATFGYQLRYMAETYGAFLGQAERPTWSVGGRSKESDRQEQLALGLQHCRRVKGRLDAFSAQLGGEQEAARIVELWHRYCGRYQGGEPERAEPSALARKEPVPHMKLVHLDDSRNNDFTPQDDNFDL